MLRLLRPRTCRPLKPVSRRRLVDVGEGEVPLGVVLRVHSLLLPVAKKSYNGGGVRWKPASQFCYALFMCRLLALLLLQLLLSRLADLRGCPLLLWTAMRALPLMLRLGPVTKLCEHRLPVVYLFNLPLVSQHFLWPGRL